MHLPGKKNAAPEISEPGVPRMEDQTLLHTVHNVAEANPTGTTSTHGPMHPHPDLAHVYQQGANQPAGANAAQDLKRGLEAGQQPVSIATQEPSTRQGNPNVHVVEEKLPFKEQVRAYHKIHRGTLLGDHELKEEGEKILSGETPPQ